MSMWYRSGVQDDALHLCPSLRRHNLSSGNENFSAGSSFVGAILRLRRRRRHQCIRKEKGRRKSQGKKSFRENCTSVVAEA